MWKGGICVVVYDVTCCVVRREAAEGGTLRETVVAWCTDADEAELIADALDAACVYTESLSMARIDYIVAFVCDAEC